MEYNQESKTNVAVIAIIFLTVMIIIPPVLRTFLPKNAKKEPASKIETTLLDCSRITSDLYKEENKVVYENGQATRVTMFFTSLKPPVTPSKTKEPTRSAQEEIAFFKSFDGAIVEETQEPLTITITKRVQRRNGDNLELANYFQAREDQILTLAAQGYTCSTSKI